MAAPERVGGHGPDSGGSSVNSPAKFGRCGAERAQVALRRRSTRPRAVVRGAGARRGWKRRRVPQRYVQARTRFAWQPNRLPRVLAGPRQGIEIHGNAFRTLRTSLGLRENPAANDGVRSFAVEAGVIDATAVGECAMRSASGCTAWAIRSASPIHGAEKPLSSESTINQQWRVCGSPLSVTTRPPPICWVRSEPTHTLGTPESAGPSTSHGGVDVLFSCLTPSFSYAARHIAWTARRVRPRPRRYGTVRLPSWRPRAGDGDESRGSVSSGGDRSAD